MLEITVAPPGPPRTYLGIANALVPGIRVLAESAPVPALPLTLLCAHALECVLKACLSRNGDDSPVKQAKVRHNLNLLWVMAFEDGLEISQTPPSWADLLSNLHGWPYYLRYATGVPGLVLPPPREVVSGLLHMLDQVRAKI